jgi:hypothetical protein
VGEVFFVVVGDCCTVVMPPFASDVQMEYALDTSAAYVAFAPTVHLLHAGPSAIITGQKHASSGHAEAADLIGPHESAQFGAAVGDTGGFVVVAAPPPPPYPSELQIDTADATRPAYVAFAPTVH